MVKRSKRKSLPRRYQAGELVARWDPQQYRLLDCGEGRRLEWLGGYVVDRPCPVARWPKTPRQPWAEADAVFHRTPGKDGMWEFRRPPPENWVISWEMVSLFLKCTPFGHLGVFPEQAAIWRWLSEVLSQRKEEPLRILNLFAYTGGATLVAASYGAEVFHIDAARNVLMWARKNADRSGLSEAKIHWICEDAVRFVEREVRRGRKYDAFILDPPSYGHGPEGEVWQFRRDLPRLLELCGRLASPKVSFLVLTAHTQGYSPETLAAVVREHFAEGKQGELKAGQIFLPAESGRKLPSGFYVYWSSV